MSTSLSAPGARVRVLIAGADYMGSQLIASALRRCRNEFEIVGIASNTQDTVREVEVCKPDVALLSAGLQDGPQTGLVVLEKLRNSDTSTATVMLLHSLDRDTVVEAFRGGARGIISRADSFKALAKCIRCVHDGQIWANNSQIQYLVDALTELKPRLARSKGMALLTPREQEVIHLVAEGLKNREIAQRLHVTEHTVSNYLYRIFDKLGVSSRVELILYALSRQKSA
jgi:DNA-binding NarL/FixJ family response regulator